MIMGIVEIRTTLLVLILTQCDLQNIVESMITTPTSSNGTRDQEDTASGDIQRMEAFGMQVGGHTPALGKADGKDSKALMKDTKEGNLLKGDVNERDVQFYENLKTTNDPILKQLREFVPRYYGLQIVRLKDDGEEHEYLSMEDLTNSFTLPSVIDIKMGDQNWEPGKSKTDKHKEKHALMKEHCGFCIPGARYFDIGGNLHEFGRPAVHSMAPRQAIQYLYEYFNRQSGLKFGLVDKVVDELRKIYRWFETQRYYKFYGSSILIVYDTVSLKMGHSSVRVRMIDFAHAVPNRELGEEGKDEKYMRGLKNLTGLLDNLETAVRKYTNLAIHAGTSNRNAPMNDAEQEKTTYVTLPDDFIPFDQIAGRVINKKGKKLGFLQDKKGNLLKPDPHQEEIDFYETVNKTTDPILTELRQYTPTYFGIKTLYVEGEAIHFLHIEDIFHDFEIPCRLDAKIGFKRRPHWAPPKLAERLFKYKAMLAKWKFAIPGYEIYRVPLEEVPEPQKKSRKLTYHMQPEEGVETLLAFVNDEWGIKCGLVESILIELRKIEAWFERQRNYQFFDSSVFMTYDAKRVDDFAKGLLTASACRSSKIPVRVRMIDFGNTFPVKEDEKDGNYLEGLRNLITIFEKFPKFNPDDGSRIVDKGESINEEHSGEKPSSQ